MQYSPVQKSSNLMLNNTVMSLKIKQYTKRNTLNIIIKQQKMDKKMYTQVPFTLRVKMTKNQS